MEKQMPASKSLIVCFGCCFRMPKVFVHCEITNYSILLSQVDNTLKLAAFAFGNAAEVAELNIHA